MSTDRRPDQRTAPSPQWLERGHALPDSARRNALRSVAGAIPLVAAMTLSGVVAFAPDGGRQAMAADAKDASAWPQHPLRMIIPFPPGGGTDILARLIGSKLNETKGWTVVADNKAGAGGTLGITEAVKAQPNGHEFVMGQKDNLVIGPWLYRRLSWNPVRDLVPVAHVAYTPVIIATRKGGKYTKLQEVIDAARKAPGTITYGSPGNGTSIHLAVDLFARAAGIELSHIPYKGSNPAMVDAIAGNIDLLASSVPSAMAQIKAGKLVPLAVTSATRSSSLPDVPTLAELGHKDFDVSTWYGVLAPAKTPDEVVRKMNAAVNELLARKDVQEAIQAQGAEPKAMDPAPFAAMLKEEYESWKKIVDDSGVRIE